MQEEAAGITLYGVRSRAQHLAIELLQERMNKSAVVAGAVFDLLTAQCDRE